MEEDIENYKLGSTIQEFEELFGNTPFEDIEKIKKYIFNNYIPKSKVKEKIEELEEEKANFFSQCFIEERDNKIEVLQELLREE